jgi:hypothetical protein
MRPAIKGLTPVMIRNSDTGEAAIIARCKDGKPVIILNDGTVLAMKEWPRWELDWARMARRESLCVWLAR